MYGSEMTEAQAALERLRTSLNRLWGEVPRQHKAGNRDVAIWFSKVGIEAETILQDVVAIVEARPEITKAEIVSYLKSIANFQAGGTSIIPRYSVVIK